MPVVRISRGSFEPEHHDRVRARLQASEASLLPAIRKLKGCLHYWAGIETTRNTMVNVSVWETMEDAEQMAGLAPMLALAREFVALGVTFERPILNYQTLWTLP